VRAGQLLDVVEGRDSGPASRWLAKRDKAWRTQIRFGTLDMSGPYRKVYDTMLPDAIQVADPFHVVKVRRQAPCVRGRVRDPTRWPVAAGR
jgi:transposase